MVLTYSLGLKLVQAQQGVNNLRTNVLDQIYEICRCLFTDSVSSACLVQQACVEVVYWCQTIQSVFLYFSVRDLHGNGEPGLLVCTRVRFQQFIFMIDGSSHGSTPQQHGHCTQMEKLHDRCM